MGAGRRPILPAPTDSSAVESAEEEEYTDTGLGTDLATDLTTRTFSTSKTIPADGTPITIPTGQSSKRSKFGRQGKSRNKSHTSLLIEYFEEGPDDSRLPSVRVKIPESARRSTKGEDHIVLTETHGPRKISRNISLSSNDLARISNPGNFSSLASLEGHQRTGPEPIEVEVLGREGSEISQLSEARYIEPTSDISSMPADSLHDGQAPLVVAVDTGSRGIGQEDVMEEETLKVPRQPYAQEPSRSTERLTQKVIEKIQNKPRTTTSGTRRRHGEKTSSRSVSRELVEGESRRRSGKGREDATLATESSLASNSLLSANPKSLDAGSVRSGTSQGSSITNPRLLHTVEDAIRRLILPELNQMKNEQRKISGSKRYEKNHDPSDISESSISREDVSRRISKRRTSDDPKIVRSGSRDAGEVLSSGRRRHLKKHRDSDLDSPSERSYRRRESVDSVSVDDSPAKSSKHRHRDLAAAALAGGALTAAALKYHEHDSRSDVDRRERRRKHRSKSRSSRSRSESIAESEDVFHRHEVPPMPMRSEIGSEVTRSSLLSEKTADTMTPPPQQSLREVVRGSPREVSSPTSSTPKQIPGEQKRGLSGLGMHHSNFSDRNLSGQNLDEHARESYTEENTPSKWGTAAAGAAGAGIGALAAEHFLEDPERAKAYEANLHHQHPIRRGLSPIQSVASYQTTEPNRNSVMHSRSIDSLNSPEKQQQLLREEPSYNSFSSANSIDLAKRANQRPLGIHMENPSEVLAPHNDKFENSRDINSQQYADDEFYDDQHDQNDRYRDSYASSDPKVDARRMTNYTDDSMDAPYLDKVTAGQQVARGYGANPEYVHTPPGVESAVASLYDPSLVDVRSNRSPAHSYSNSIDQQIVESPAGMTRELQDRPMGSPLRQAHPVASPELLKIHNRGLVNSPVHSIAESFEQREREAKMTSQSPVRSPAVQATMSQDQKDATSPESEITTNPSIIQGPIGGVAKGNRDHWPYDPTPPTNKYTISSSRDMVPMAAAAGVGAMLGAGAAQAHISDKPRGLHIGNTVMPPSPGAEDEGYITGVNPKSPEIYADKTRDLDNITPANEQMEMPLPGEDDPFTSKKGQYLSGFSQGMGSPLYDSSTGQGMDRIQSKDIVALMDHLTVRDAQRNARDTEILVTLVRSAAEMRNSFEDMKKFITDTGDEIMDTGDKQHEETQKIIGGPRPQPQSTRSLERTPKSQGYQSDEPAQRKNVFKRALQGLGSKNKTELQNIEAMFMQLLGEMESLKSSQGVAPGNNIVQGSRSINSAENVRAPTDPGYEPEGQAGTSSTGVGNSGFFSNNSSRQDHYRSATGGLRESGNRVSTVMEGDEEHADEAEYEGQRTPNQQYPHGAPYGSPSQEVGNTRDVSRGQSQPLRTPPRIQQQEQQVRFSNENTPNSNSGSKAKHKSTASSFFPRISRWSKTTASTITDNFRSSGQQAKQRPYSEVSRSGASGEHIGDYDYDPHGDDRLRSNNSFANDEQYHDQENRPPSPLIPSQVSEKPKYQAVRNSINLEHPQPRQGPTGRYQHHLENEAQTYAGNDLSPTSQTSSQWNQQGHGALNSIPNSQGYSQNRDLSPVSYSDTSSAMREVSGEQGRPRSFRSANSREGPTPPPKVRDDDDPLVPTRPPKIAMTPPNNRPITYADQVAAARSGSPAYTKVSFLPSPDPQTSY